MKKVLSSLALATLLVSTVGCSHDSTSNYQYKTGGNYSKSAHNVKHLHSTFYFEYDSSALSEASKEALLVQVDHIKRHANDSFVIEGHCDERGTREYNLGLGERRANAVKEFLVHHGVSASQLVVVSYGEERPAVLGSNEDAWAQNRRAVVVHM